MNNEAKETETSEFGAENGLLPGHTMRQVTHALKSPRSLKGFRKAFFKRQVREGEGQRVCNQLVHNSVTVR